MEEFRVQLNFQNLISQVQYNRKNPLTKRMKAAEKSNYNELPLRNRNRSDGTFKKCGTERFVSNYFEARIDNSVSTIYQYDYKLYDEKNHQIEPNSQLYRVFINQNKINLQKVLGFQMAKGQMAFCRKDQPMTNLKCQIKLNNKYRMDEKNEEPLPQKMTLQGVFKKVKDIDVNNIAYVGCPEEAMIKQLLNINIKNKLKNADMQELGRTGKYFHKNPQVLKVKSKDRNQQKTYDQLKVIAGYKFNLLTYNSRYVLQVDTCFRVLQATNFREELRNKIMIEKYSQDQVNQEYKGQTATAMYGNFRNYSIIKIDFGKNPKSKFTLENGAEITYEQYYRKNYNIDIQDLKQPLVQVPLSVDKKINTKGQIVKKQQTIYLIPELICIAGLKTSQQKNRQVMRALADITKMSPEVRMQKCISFVQKLGKENNLVKINPSPLKLDGFLLDLPTLIYGNKKEVKPTEKGIVKTLGKLKNTAKFDEYLFVYSHQNDYDKQFAYVVLEQLRKASKIYGVEFNKALFLPIKNSRSVKQWINTVRQDCKQNGNPPIIIFLLNERQEGYYADLKAAAINEIQCPSQVIRKRTFKASNYKAIQSAASKLTIQMNVKIGLPAWEVRRSHIYFNQKKVMYGAVTVSKGKNGIYLAFVGTINDASSQFFGTCKKIEGNLNIPTAALQQIYVEWAKNYYKTEKQVPDDIIIYREGLNQTQASRLVKQFEVPALQQMIKTIGKNTKTTGYKPNWQIVGVNRKINARFFSQDKGKVINPESGSFITQNFEEGNTFQLAPQYVHEGTLTPTRYIMLHDSSQISKQALISFTYEQSFNYFNWQGAVRVPGCLQYANKLAKLTSQHLKEDIQKSSLNKLLFYL